MIAFRIQNINVITFNKTIISQRCPHTVEDIPTVRVLDIEKKQNIAKGKLSESWGRKAENLRCLCAMIV